MHTLLIIIGVNAATFGFAFLLAGWLSLAAPSEGETEDVRWRYDTARQKGWIQAQLFVMSLRYEGTNQGESPIIGGRGHTLAN